MHTHTHTLAIEATVTHGHCLLSSGTERTASGSSLVIHLPHARLAVLWTGVADDDSHAGEDEKKKRSGPYEDRTHDLRVISTAL